MSLSMVNHEGHEAHEEYPERAAYIHTILFFFVPFVVTIKIVKVQNRNKLKKRSVNMRFPETSWQINRLIMPGRARYGKICFAG